MVYAHQRAEGVACLPEYQQIRQLNVLIAQCSFSQLPYLTSSTHLSVGRDNIQGECGQPGSELEV